jgi:ribosomal protein L17
MPKMYRSKGKSASKRDTMRRVTPEALLKNTSFHTTPKKPCTHSCLVDDILTATGIKTGELICKECKAVLSDLAFQKPVP